MATATAYKGYDGKVFSGATDMQVTEWSGELKITEIDITTTADEGYTSSLGGPVEITGKFTAFYDVAKSPTGATANLVPGTIPGPTLSLYTGGGDLLTGEALITQLSFKSEVKGAITFEVSFRNRGKWTLPGAGLVG